MTLNVGRRVRQSNVGDCAQREFDERGFSLLETMIALGLSGGVISACLFLAGESSKQVGQRIAGSKGYLALQNLSEQLLISNGANGYLDDGPHGPLYFDSNGRASATAERFISVTWNVKYNDPQPNVIKIGTRA